MSENYYVRKIKHSFLANIGKDYGDSYDESADYYRDYEDGDYEDGDYGYDEDYGRSLDDSDYVATDPIDPCDHKRTMFDVDGEAECDHISFANLTPINGTREFSNKTVKPCCTHHGYLFIDNCKVEYEI